MVWCGINVTMPTLRHILGFAGPTHAMALRFEARTCCTEGVKQITDDSPVSLPGRVAAALAQRQPETGQTSNHSKSSEYWIARSRTWSRKCGPKCGRAMTVIKFYALNLLRGAISNKAAVLPWD